tara:strand:+ start:4595 stop:6229 length:1635 start_codon:yes stop_codon:yes gene_type:complete
MSIKPHDKLDTTLIDLYLNGDVVRFHPGIPATLYSETLSDQLSDEDIDYYVTNSGNRNVIITPLRTAWEMGKKWSKYFHNEKLIPDNGGSDVCEYENGYFSENNSRTLVVGWDPEHYERECLGFTDGNYKATMVFQKSGYDNDDNWRSDHLPPAVVSYRGWAACDGWHGFRRNTWATPFSSDNNCPNGDIGDLDENGNQIHGCMSNGHFFIVFSQVCDTGDPFSFSENGGETSQCNRTCNNFVSAMSNASLCFNSTHHQGAVGFIGPSDLDTDTRFNNMIQGMFMDSVTVDGYRELGDIFYKAKEKFHWGLKGVQCPCDEPDCDNDSICDFFYLMVYQLSGDPSLPMYIGKPSKITTNYDDFFTPSPWGRFKQRPKIMPERTENTGEMSDQYPEDGKLSDEIALSLSQRNSISINAFDEDTGELLVGANATLVYKKQPSYPFDQVYSYCEDNLQSGCQYYSENNPPYGPSGMKNYMTYLLKYVEIGESGIIEIENWNLPETWIEGQEEIGNLVVGSYLQLFINTETIRHGKSYEQKVLTFRIVE